MKDSEEQESRAAANAMALIIVFATFVFSMLLISEPPTKKEAGSQASGHTPTKRPSEPPVLTPLPHIVSLESQSIEETLPSGETDVMPPLDLHK